MMGNEVDPIEYARFVERLTAAVATIKESFGNFQSIQREFSDTVLEKLVANERQSVLNEKAREQLDDLEKTVRAHIVDYTTVKTTFKVWLGIALAVAGFLGGMLGNYASNHVK